MGDIGGWGVHGGSKDARVTLRHTVHGQTSPTLQVRTAFTEFSISPSTSLSQTLHHWIILGLAVAVLTCAEYPYDCKCRLRPGEDLLTHS